MLSESIDTARNEAIEHIRQYGWVPKVIQYEIAITDEHIQELHPAEYKLWEKVQFHGIAMDMIAGMDEQTLPDGSHLEIPMDKLLD